MDNIFLFPDDLKVWSTVNIFMLIKEQNCQESSEVVFNISLFFNLKWKANFSRISINFKSFVNY